MNDDPSTYSDTESRPATIDGEDDDWDSYALADALNRATRQREAEALRERIVIIGWLFVLAFVVLFLLVIRWLS